MIRPKDGKFNQQIEDIDRAIERLNSLKTAASIAQQTDMKNMLQDAGHGTYQRGIVRCTKYMVHWTTEVLPIYIIEVLGSASVV